MFSKIDASLATMFNNKKVVKQNYSFFSFLDQKQIALYKML